MNPEQADLARRALDDMKTVSVEASQPHDERSFADLLQANDIVHGIVSMSDLTVTGFGREGVAAIANLARTFRPYAGNKGQRANNTTVAKVIAGQIIAQWKGRPSASLVAQDFTELCGAIDDWFDKQAQLLKHFVPCTLVPYRAAAFAIGPVSFFHLSDFPSAALGLAGDEIWPKPVSRWKRWWLGVWAALRSRFVSEPAAGGFHFERLIRLAQERYAHWIALVEVQGREQAQSIGSADLAVDVALAGVQLVCSGAEFRKIARATARAASVWRADVWVRPDGGFGESVSNLQPALGISPELFEARIKEAEPLFSSMGRRVTAYLAGTGPLPDLSEAWCNAAYWYHEAVAEPLDTVAIAKLETAMEVLFRGQDMLGSKRRLLESLEAFFGLAKTDLINTALQLSVEQFVESITTARSRVLHGTWPTLVTDLPGAKGRKAVTFGDVEELARLLLLQFTAVLDAYIEVGNAVDTTDAFLAWVKANRAVQTATAGSSPSGL